MTVPASQRVVLEGALANPFHRTRQSLADLRDASKVLPPGMSATRRADGSIRRAESIASSIYASGDSITAGQGDEASLGGWPGRLATLTGFTVVNGGIAGQASSDIALRQGGLVPLITVAGNTIPSTGTIAVSVLKPSTSWRTGSAFSFTGFVIDAAGVAQPVTLAHSGASVAPDKAWTVGRASGSGAITIAPETPFYVSDADAYVDHTLIAWLGRNNSAPNNYDDAIRDTLTMIAHLRPVRPRYLVVSILTGSAEVAGTGAHDMIVATNRKAEATFGERYVDMRRYLIDYGLAAAGITPTTADLTAIAGDTVPPSLLSDGLHPNAAGYTVIANYLKERLIALGWAQGTILFESSFTGDAGAPLNADIGSAAWTTTDANWKLDGAGNAYNTAPASTSYAVVDAGTSDVVVRVVLAGTFNFAGGLALRFQDGSNQIALTWEDASGHAPRLAKRVANSSTVITPNAGTQVTGDWAPGDVLEMTISGTTFTLTKNGTVVGVWSDSAFQALTRFGLFLRTAGAAIQFSHIRISKLP